jgi:hypothetical protein
MQLALSHYAYTKVLIYCVQYLTLAVSSERSFPSVTFCDKLKVLRTSFNPDSRWTNLLRTSLNPESHCFSDMEWHRHYVFTDHYHA